MLCQKFKQTLKSRAQLIRKRSIYVRIFEENVLLRKRILEKKWFYLCDNGPINKKLKWTLFPTLKSNYFRLNRGFFHHNTLKDFKLTDKHLIL